MKCLIGYSVTLKCLTWNDLDMPFMLKFVFVVGLTRFFGFAFGDNCVKTNEDTPYCQLRNACQGL